MKVQPYKMSQEDRAEMHRKGNIKNEVEKKQRNEGMKKFGYYTQRHIKESPKSKALKYKK
jgi:hypothetical protein